MSESNLKFVEPPQSNERVVAAEIAGEITTGDMKVLIEKLQAFVERGEKSLLYIDMRHYDGFEFGVVAEKLKNMGTLWKAIEKYAIIGASRWMEIWIDIVNPLTPQHIRHFSPENSDEAWRWLLAPTSGQ